MYTIPQQAIDAYIERNNTSACAYFYDLAGLRRHVRSLKSLLPQQCELFYAIKANSEREILETLAPLVDGFDTASLGEVKKIRKLGGDHKIALGGPAKTPDELQRAVAEGAELFHIESALQLNYLNRVACDADRQLKVLLRINPAIEMPHATLQMAGKPTQFGIEQQHADEVIELCSTLPGIKLVGFHFHAVSNQLDANAHISLIEQYLNIVASWQERYGIDVEFINVGGGIGVNYQQQDKQFDWPAFCTRLSQLLDSRNSLLTDKVKIIFECGRFLSAFCGFYLTEVVDIKHNHGTDYALLRGGSHHFRLPVSWQHNHPFVVVKGKPWQQSFSRPSLQQGKVTLCGELCTPKDVLASDVNVDTLAVGDYVLFVLAGAYGWGISHHDFLSHAYPDFIYLDSDTSGE